MSNRDRNRPKEPQSYGSEKDWVEGKTGQTVENTPSRVSRHDEAHYEDRHDPGPTETHEPAMERDTSSMPSGGEVVGEGGKKIAESNERRKNQGYFRERDYE